MSKQAPIAIFVGETGRQDGPFIVGICAPPVLYRALTVEVAPPFLRASHLAWPFVKNFLARNDNDGRERSYVRRNPRSAA
jgi:hypothetical protein